MNKHRSNIILFNYGEDRIDILGPDESCDIVIDKNGLTFKGKAVEDAGELYKAFSTFLGMVVNANS